MVRLETTVKLSGLNQGDVRATLVERIQDLCIYERSDGVFEVFYVNKLPAGNVFGKDYPERESYPSNEDFGRTAWCFTSLFNAKVRYDALVNKDNLSDQPTETR